MYHVRAQGVDERMINVHYVRSGSMGNDRPRCHHRATDRVMFGDVAAFVPSS